MLVNFKVSNFRSIKEEIEFSMVAGSNVDRNFTAVKNYNLLNSAVIFGANASGKSNFLRSFRFMRSLVLNLPKIIQSTDRLPYEPFLLSPETENGSSTFEVIFIAGESRFRYGFEVDSEVVYSEWLFVSEKGKEARLFFRDVDEEFYVNPDKFKEGKGVKLQSNGLFLWKCDQEGGEISKQILKWFKETNVINAANPTDFLNYSIKKLDEPGFRDKIIELMRSGDFSIQNLAVEKNDVPLDEFEKLSIPDSLKEEIQKNPQSFQRVGLKSIHKKYDENGIELGDPAVLNFLKSESEGTKKFFTLSAPLLDTILNNKVLFVDELDASLHPHLVNALLSLFTSKLGENSRAQLIFTTHDTNILNSNEFHKSQIWLAEKNAVESTELVSLAEYKGIRDTDNLSKNYLMGKYGAIPSLQDFQILKGAE